MVAYSFQGDVILLDLFTWKKKHSIKILSFTLFISAHGAVAVLFLQGYGEHGLETSAISWVQVVVLVRGHITAEVLVAVTALLTMLTRLLAVVVQH